MRRLICGLVAALAAVPLTAFAILTAAPAAATARARHGERGQRRGAHPGAGLEQLELHPA